MTSTTESTQQPLRIVHLRVRDFMGINAVEIDPPSGAVKIAGKNAQGKTSLLTALLYAFAGKRYAPEMPIKAGERRSLISVELSNGYTVTRKDTQNDSYLEVTSSDGTKTARPQEFLHALGADGLAFDPLEFANADAKRQRAMLMRLVGIDPEVFDNQKAAAAENRRTAKALLKQAETSREQLRANLPAMPSGRFEPLDEIRAAVARAEEEVRQLASKRDALARTQRDGELMTASMKAQRETYERSERAREVRIRELMASLEQEQQALKADHAAWMDTAKELQTKIDKAAQDCEAAEAALASAGDVDGALAEAKQELAAATTFHAQVDKAKLAAKQLETITANVRELERKVKTAEEAVLDIDASLQKAMADAKSPVPGIAFSDDGHTLLDGVPFSQAASSARLKTSVLIMMGLQKPDGLRVMITRDGSLLDPESLQAMCDLSETRGWQLFIELTNGGEAVDGGFTIVDGSLKSA